MCRKLIPMVILIWITYQHQHHVKATIATSPDFAQGEDQDQGYKSVGGKLIDLAATPYKSYTHYLTKSVIRKNISYNFTVKSPPEYWLFVNIDTFGFKNQGSIYNWLADDANDKFKQSLCDYFIIKVTNFQNKQTDWHCGYDTKSAHYRIESSEEKVEITTPVQLFVEISARPRSKQNSLNLTHDYNIRGFPSRPLIGPNGKETPKLTMGQMTFTSYKDCSTSKSIDSDLVSCSDQAKDAAAAACIHSELFCDGASNCLRASYFHTNLLKRDGGGRAYDEGEEKCGKHVRIKQWKEKPTSATEDWDSESISSGTDVYFLLIGIIAVVVMSCGCVYGFIKR